ncbi:unnamed protein product [Ranitomeya imitator]|uniref:GIY-YIG domain-containing protein n=1 Tax=Ranitomeya imitator TaxID=111125 RepID=A0ABN9MKH8_9NEOB|nr:unnamed protein product [Ranitomeya imitator]
MLSYNQSEAESILAQVNIPSQFLHTSTDQLKTRDLERIYRRKTALQLHYVTLAEYHKVQRIPRGLRVSLRPTLFSEKMDFCEKFEAILNKCSMDLILLTVDYLHKEIPTIESEIASIESQLRNTMSQDEFNKIKTQNDKAMVEFQSQLQERKRLKFIRDSEDYQRGEVYRWTNSETAERRPPRRWNSSFSSGSESDGSRSSFRSHQGRGRGRNSRNRGNRQNPSGTESSTTRMQTRSQVSNDQLVYNISSHVLSSMELYVLQKGLSFCPTPPFNDFILDQELSRFFRSLRLKVHFSNVISPPTTTVSSIDTDCTTDNVTDTTLSLRKLNLVQRNEFFIQLNGTAMGSNVAPPYANIFMADFESKFVYTHVLFQQFCPLWKRYIDDIFLIWCGDLDSLLSFYQSINTSVDKLTFSIQHDQKSIYFLDTLVTINDDRSLSTDLFVKSTDKNSLLLFTSCHPRHIKRSLPRSQYSRINRIVSDPSLRAVRLNEMASKFRNRGYPDSFLDFPLDNSPLTTPQPRVNRMAFVNTYHPFMPMFHGLIRKHWPLLGLSYPGIPEFQVAPLMCHKKPPNLRNLLVSADIGSSKLVTRQTFLATARKGTFPCLHCLQCSKNTRGDTFTHPRSGKRFPIRGFFSCDSTYVIYLIKCPCGLGYVGETSQHIRDRISQHKSTIRIAQLRYQIIDSIPIARRGGNRILKLKQREAYWIHILQTLEPYGLNRDFDLYHHTVITKPNYWKTENQRNQQRSQHQPWNHGGDPGLQEDQELIVVGYNFHTVEDTEDGGNPVTGMDHEYGHNV